MAMYIVPAIIFVVVLAIGGYYGARFMKGKLKLELSRDTANSGAALAGGIELEAKKSIKGLLKVSLIGREKREKRGSGDDSNSTEWVEVYRQDQILEETQQFPAGFTKKYRFELTAPTTSQVRSGGAALQAMADKAGDGMVGGVMKMAAGAAKFMGGRIFWHVEARLDAAGVDLVDKEKCQVNLRG